MHYTTSCNTQSSAPEDGQNQHPKPVELVAIINTPLLLHLVGVYIIYINDLRSNKYRIFKGSATLVCNERRQAKPLYRIISLDQMKILTIRAILKQNKYGAERPLTTVRLMQGQLVGTALEVRGFLSGLDNDVTYSGRTVNALLIKDHTVDSRQTQKHF